MSSLKIARMLCIVLSSWITLVAQEAAPIQQTPPLFKAYPALQENVGYSSLGTFPTPIKKLDVLGSIIGCNQLYLKQDNLSGDLFGGNKVRKLEFLLGDALKENAKGVLTVGAAGSNHTCCTAIYCNKLNLPCYCMHMCQQPTSYLRRNLLLSAFYGANLSLYDTACQREIALHKKNREFYKQTGGFLYFIPYGGSNEIGTVGFVNAMFELKEQITQGLMPEPDYIYVTLGSCGTAAGLILGAKVAGLKSIIVPVCIEHESVEKQHETKLTYLYRIASKYLHKHDKQIPELELDPADITINYDFVGKGYAQISQEAQEAIRLLFETENIKLDGTYTGKTCAAMLHDIVTKNIKDKVILFWDSYCSGDFANITQKVDYKTLPESYHRYFQCHLQPNDQGA